MPDSIKRLQEWAEGRHRRIERAVLMHATSPYREAAARLLAKFLQESGASGVAFGWTDVLAPSLLSPVHVVTAHPGVIWSLDSLTSHSELIDTGRPYDWQLVFEGVSPRRMEQLLPSIEYIKGYFAEAAGRDIPRVLDPDEVHPFVSLLDAFRFCGFAVTAKAAPAIQHRFRHDAQSLPESAQEAAEAVVDSLRVHEELQKRLLRLGSVLDIGGDFASAAAVHLIGYELALQRCDGMAGIDAARSAGRAFRRMGNLDDSLRWYRLATRLAEFEEAWDRLALALDGAGNTHRHAGSFPRARETYTRAWKYAKLSGDDTAIGNVSHSMALIERWAGDLAAASTYAWTALDHAQDSDTRARALIGLGSILREGNDLQHAVMAFCLAKTESKDPGYRAMATDALAYCAAIRGDRVGYARLRAEVREGRIREPFIRAQLGYFRARSLYALGRPRHARRMLEAVERYSRQWALAQWEVSAAELEPPPQDARMETPDEVRRGLRALQVAST